MMKSRFIISLLLFCIINCLYANAKYVKFSVDMTGIEINTTGVHVAGDFQTLAGYSKGDWQSNSTEMIREGSTNIFSVVVNIPADAKYEYKFINGDQWYDAEFVPEESRVGFEYNDNRWLWVDSTATDTCFTEPIKYGANAPDGKFLARFSVDLSKETDVNKEGVYLGGEFIDNTNKKIRMYSFSDKVYQVITFVTTGNYQYKFYNGSDENGAETVPSSCAINGFRSLNISKDVVKDTVIFSKCSEQTAVEEIPNACFTIMPNPATDVSYLNFKTSNNRTVSIYNLCGELVFQLESTSDVIKLDLSSLFHGIYIIKIVDRDFNHLNISKLIVK